MAENDSTMEGKPHARLYVVCGVKNVKEVKNWLEGEKVLFRGEKIKSAVFGNINAEENRGLMLIPTTGLLSQATFDYDGYKTTLQAAARSTNLTLNIGKLSQRTRDSVSARFYTVTMPKADVRSGSTRDANKPDEPLNILQQRFKNFLALQCTYDVIADINQDDDETEHLSMRKLLAEAPKRWTLYAPLVMLPPGSLSKDWQRLLNASFEGDRNFLWQDILAAFSTEKIEYTHLAVNKGIPLDNADKQDNVIRAPSADIQKLYGWFGPDIEAKRFYLPSDSEDIICQEDFEEAFWVETKQNGLTQTWAPRWTMFSRGNVKEKARVLKFEKAFGYTKEGKRQKEAAKEAAKMPAQPAQNKWVSSAKGKDKGPLTPLMPQIAGSTMRDAMVIDSPSPGDDRPYVYDRCDAMEVQMNNPWAESEGVPSPRSVQTTSSPFQQKEIIDLASSPAPNQESGTEEESLAESAKPAQRAHYDPVSYDGPADLESDDDEWTPLPPANITVIPLPPPTWSPIEQTQSRVPLPNQPCVLQVVGPLHPNLDRNGGSKFQEVQLAVDMYAGIGYFTFSYLKLGYDVLAYELNPFSVEGLKRGAEANGFGCTVLRGQDLEDICSEERRNRDDRHMRWSGRRGSNGNDTKDPIVLDDGTEMVIRGTRKKTVCVGCAKGTCVQNFRAWNKTDWMSDPNEVQHTKHVEDKDDALWDEKVDEAVSRGESVSAALNTALTTSKENPIVINDDEDEVVHSRAESPLFVSQDSPATTTTHRPLTNRQTNVPTPSPRPLKPDTRYKLGTATLPPQYPRPQPTTPPTLHSLESTLQNQFKRKPHVIVYEQTNQEAHKNLLDLCTLGRHRGGNPYKIRHVNLGFLPSSSESWETAAQLVGSNNEGGFVHVHENVGVDDIAKHGEKVRLEFDEMINAYYGDRTKKRGVQLVHTEMVKSFAPGVWHVVYDIRVGEKMAVSRDEARQRKRDGGYGDRRGDGYETE